LGISTPAITPVAGPLKSFENGLNAVQSHSDDNMSTAPGRGSVHLTSQPAQFASLAFSYPLKLISPSPLEHHFGIVHTLFLLTYGGGLVAGDSICLDIKLDPGTKLLLLTQGSTKIFKTADPKVLTRQDMHVSIQNGAALCYIPDPVQPFQDSAFTQSQIYRLATGASLCVCDWVCCGRPARGERWDFWTYGSRNEVWTGDGERLMLRDNVLIDAAAPTSPREAFDKLGVFGTLILRGPAFDRLGSFFLSEFELMPRIGEKKWDDETTKPDAAELKRADRLQRERADGLLWTAVRTRGFVVVKFGSREVEGAKHWLRSLVRQEGGLEQCFGERALLCLK
jgi:urease accessory protein